MKEQSNELKKAKRKIDGLESELNKAKIMLADVDQLKTDLAAVEEACDTNYVAINLAQGKATTVEVALVELQAVACGPVYE